MLSVPKGRDYSPALVAHYRRAAQVVAGLVGMFSILAVAAAPRGYHLAQLEPHTSLDLLAGAAAILLLIPAFDGRPNPLRGWGYGAAAATLALGLANSPRWMVPGLDPQPNAWALCFTLLGISLLVKARLPRLAVGFDIFVGFAGCLVVLEGVFGISSNPKPVAHPIHFVGGIGMFALSAAWMMSFPRHRPVGYFVETGSAGMILRRVLPVTFVFPVLLIVLTAVQRHTKGAMAQLGGWILLLSGVAFGVALIWIIAQTLDRTDALRTLSEADLRSSEERYRLLFENNPQPMWFYDAESLAFIAVNESACRVYGYSREEFLGLTILDIRPSGDRAAVRQEIAQGNTADGTVWKHITKAGTQIEVEVFSHPLQWQGRSARVAFAHNITGRRQAEAQLRESESQVRTLLESTVEGIYAVDLDGQCIWCNPAALRSLGMSAAHELLGKNVHSLIHHTRADGTPYPIEECEMMFATRQGLPYARDEEKLWRADGSSFPADCRSSPLLRDGQLTGAVVSFADVSERKNLQSQFQQAQKMEAIGRLAAGIAHDFNNLLTVINGYTEMLLRRPIEPDLHAKVANIRKAGERAAGLTQQLLAFSRQQVLQPKVLDLNAVLAEMDSLLRRVLGEDLTLVTDLAPDLAPVRADPNQISQVLMNLVVNARDAMPNGGRLTIETANVELDARYAASHPEVSPGKYAMLAVTDNGCGMDAVAMAHLFEPFFTTKAVGQGTGLGLATVFGIVKQSGGSISAYSEPGHGTAMKVYLPSLARPSDALPGTMTEGSEALPRGRETVLIVEDEEIVRDLLREILESSGYAVLVADGPLQAVALCQHDPDEIDLLVTDVVMPGMDGRSLAAMLAAQRPQMAVLFISGYPDKAISHNGDLEAGLSFIQKPFTPDALARKVRAVLDAPLERRSFRASPQ